mmetsp:Transcript_38532/g.83714  ORF Transcript_38532/g.83714 Transcript_38532/m.83714 type:complete len:296 (+) Transcript_38532:245-1132(+)
MFQHHRPANLIFNIVLTAILIAATMAKTTTTLVVGSTGATGKHVVAQLLQQDQNVRAIARSKSRLLALLDEIIPDASTKYASKLQVTEAAILDLSDDELSKIVAGCDAVVQCLGHTITFRGIYRDPHRLVADSAKHLSAAIESANANVTGSKKIKFVVMGSDGVSNPDGTDDVRSRSERIILSLLRKLVPPHADNEATAAYMSHDLAKDNVKKLEWVVVRPTDLIDGQVSDYVVYDKPQGGLFGAGVTTRANCAKFMVDLVLADADGSSLWTEHTFKMPVVHDAACAAEKKDEKK